MIKDKSQFVEFDVCSSLDNAKCFLRLHGLKTTLGQRSLVIYLPGRRAFGKWAYSKAFGGAFKYSGPINQNSLAIVDLEGLSEWFENGFVIGVSTFDDKKGPLGNIVEALDIVFEGYSKHTCEFIRETYHISFHGDRIQIPESMPSRGVVEKFDPVTVLPTRVKDPLKRIPAVQSAYSKFKERRI